MNFKGTRLQNEDKCSLKNLCTWIIFNQMNIALNEQNTIHACVHTVEPRFNEVAGGRPNLFVKSRVRYIENLDITNLRGNDQKGRYIEVIVND